MNIKTKQNKKQKKKIIKLNSLKKEEEDLPLS